MLVDNITINGDDTVNATLETNQLRQLDQQHHLHPFTDFRDYAANGGALLAALSTFTYDPMAIRFKTRCPVYGAAVNTARTASRKRSLIS